MPDFEFEDVARGEGFSVIVGVDEAGRGPLAGPVSAGAVILPVGFSHDLLDDSKKLTERKRELIYEGLVNDPEVRWGHAFAEAGEIDEINILRATHAAMGRAVDALGVRDGVFCLIDGLPVKGFGYESRGIVKGDGKSLSIAAASIIAKVTRDRVMVEYAEEFPEYGFERHKGYGTKVHLEALREFGATRIHRRSFAPVAAVC